MGFDVDIRLLYLAEILKLADSDPEPKLSRPLQYPQGVDPAAFDLGGSKSCRKKKNPDGAPLHLESRRCMLSAQNRQIPNTLDPNKSSLE